MAVTWDESMITGNELIDRQHREVVSLLDDLRASNLVAEDEGRRVLEKLMDFTVSHFVAEELLMSQFGYPATSAAAMIADHKEFKDYTRLRVLEFRMGNEASVLALHAFLFDWLTVHEFGMDRRLASWIRTHPVGTAEA